MDLTLFRCGDDIFDDFPCFVAFVDAADITFNDIANGVCVVDD
jgi:hypothetical protein